MKFLLDTNIFIPLEPTRLSEVEGGTEKAARFVQLTNVSGHQIYLHPAALEDLKRDVDEERRKLRLILFNKYPSLPDPPPLETSLEALLGYVEPASNDWVDHHMIAALLGDAVDFLVTEDHSICKKAAKLGLEGRVATINEATSIVRDLYDTCPLPPPAVKEIKAHLLDEDDPIFQTMTEDYSGFDEWLIKCKREHRQAWVILGKTNQLAAVCIVKKEVVTPEELKGKVLKMCSFKVAEGYNGFRYGELLLKTIFNYALINSYDWIYLTVFPKYGHLISLLEDFGFEDMGGKTERGELILSKPMSFSEEMCSKLDPLLFNIRYGPFVIKIRNVPGFIVPIRPLYHRLLFPEVEKQLELQPGNHPFGNSIRKAYLCHAPIRKIEKGSNLFFYRSEDAHSIISIGVVEGTLVSSSAGEIARYVGKRTIYTFSEIEEMCKSKVLAILFRQSRILERPIGLEELRQNKALTAAPQSIMKVQRGRLKWIQSRVNE